MLNALEFKNVLNYGENVFITALAIDSDDYEFSIYSTTLGKYLTLTTPFSSITETFFNSTKTPYKTSYLQRFQFPLSRLQKADTLIGYIRNKTDLLENYTFTIQYGTSGIILPSLVNIYGYLYDAYGVPVNGESITFTVLNSASYFDNAPATMLNATTQTDRDGKFSLSINRSYDYVLSISRLNFTKLVKLSSLPAGIETVEVAVGPGSAC